MATKKQTAAAKRNIKKAQRAWKGMTKRQHAIAQPDGRARRKPGSTGNGKFFRIEVRSKAGFKTFRVQDVGRKGGLERLAGKRHGSNGTWDTVTWLVSKKDATTDARGDLKITGPKARTILKQITGRIAHVKGDVFRARPKNVLEKDKPTPAMKRAQQANIKKAQRARKK